MSVQQMRHVKLWLAGEAGNRGLADDEVDALGEGFDQAAFVQAYDALTAGWNNCHQATNVGFNRVQRPQSNPYPNQRFAASSR